MKKLLVLLSAITFFVVLSTKAENYLPEKDQSTIDSIHIWTSPDLQGIATVWAKEYEKTNPESKIKVSPLALNKLMNMKYDPGNIGLISNYQGLNSIERSFWKIPVGRDIMVPIMNSQNPYKDEIFKKGISPEEFRNIITKTGNTNWGTILNSENTIHINCYGEKEADKSYVEDFLQLESNEIKWNNFTQTNEIIKSVLNDKYGIAFCRLTDIIHPEQNEIVAGINIIPIDINKNNKIDHLENIYSNYNTFLRGVWVGKYPKELYSNLYAISNIKPIRNDEVMFLKWIITDGQQYIHSNGHTELIQSERPSKVQRLYANHEILIENPKPTDKASILFMIVLIGAGCVFVFVSLKYIIIKPTEHKFVDGNIPKFFTEASLVTPNGLFFDKSHTWAFMERNGFIRIGIDDFLQHVTGQITKVKMKNPGDFVKKGESFLSIIQNGKQLSIQSPVTGIIRENNNQLISNSSMINSSPYSDGWIYVVESNNWIKEIKSFFMGQDYKSWLCEEFSRLKHFFSSVFKLKVTNQYELVFQDGGEMSDCPLEYLGPEVWEEFQSSFINREK